MLPLSRGPHSHLQSSLFIVNVDVAIVSLRQADVVPRYGAVSGNFLLKISTCLVLVYYSLHMSKIIRLYLLSAQVLVELVKVCWASSRERGAQCPHWPGTWSPAGEVRVEHQGAALSAAARCAGWGCLIRGLAPTFRALLVGDPVVGEGQSALPVHRRPIRGGYPGHVTSSQPITAHLLYTPSPRVSAVRSRSRLEFSQKPGQFCGTPEAVTSYSTCR